MKIKAVLAIFILVGTFIQPLAANLPPVEKMRKTLREKPESHVTLNNEQFLCIHDGKNELNYYIPKIRNKKFDALPKHFLASIHYHERVWKWFNNPNRAFRQEYENNPGKENISNNLGKTWTITDKNFAAEIDKHIFDTGIFSVRGQIRGCARIEAHVPVIITKYPQPIDNWPNTEEVLAWGFLEYVFGYYTAQQCSEQRQIITRNGLLLNYHRLFIRGSRKGKEFLQPFMNIMEKKWIKPYRTCHGKFMRYLDLEQHQMHPN